MLQFSNVIVSQGKVVMVAKHCKQLPLLHNTYWLHIVTAAICILT